MTDGERGEALMWIKRHDLLGYFLIQLAPHGIPLMLLLGMMLGWVLWSKLK